MKDADLVLQVLLHHVELVLLDRLGSIAIAGVEEACRKLDVAVARERIERFAGWGEGLTPAGDDYIVGLCAALARSPILTSTPGTR